VPLPSASVAAVPSSKFVMMASLNGTLQVSASSCVVGVQTPLWQVWSPLHTSPGPHGTPSGALVQVLEQQSSSTSLPSSQSSLAWLTEPSPQNGSGVVVLVDELVLVDVELLVLLDELLLELVLELVDVLDLALLDELE